jgi:hypothetical protein
MGDTNDLLILPLVRAEGQEQPNVEGLFVAPIPRKSARFRKQDRLALHLVFEGNSTLGSEQINQLLSSLGTTYYNTPGTVTTAQRSVAETLNQHLLDRNLRNSSVGRQAIGYLTQIVLRGRRLSIAQSGLPHAYLLSSSGVEHVHDLQLAGNGLGLSRTTHIRFSQMDLQANDAIVITIQPPASWTNETLSKLRSLGPESLRRRLLSQAGDNLDAFLLHAQPGSGELRLLRPVRGTRPTPTPTTPQPTPIDITEGAEELESQKEEMTTPPGEALIQETPPQSPPPPVQVTIESTSPQTSPASTSDQSPPKEVIPPSHYPEGKSTTLSKGSQAISRAFTTSLRALITFLKQILPDSAIFTIPPSTMAFIAVAVPVVIVAIAAVVFFQRGQAAQYDLYFSQAQEAALEAQAKTDPQELRQAWETTLMHLDNAEYFLTTDESQTLRQNAQTIVDDLNAIERLDFRTALVEELEEDALITQLVVVEDDLYMLNASDGVVERAILTNTGYRIDTTFQCGQGPYGGYIIDPLVDIAPMPKNDPSQATILGIDANGNLLRCIPGNSPLASPMEPPDINWGTPGGVAVDGVDLYILDPQINAVWIYRGMDITSAPRLFFDQQIPSMHDVIDLDINQNDLYLLHADGHLTTCVYSVLAGSPTRCQDPEIYTDPRPGRQSGPLIEDAFFSQIQFSPPPEPSIYILDPNSQSIYRFSVRLTLDRQFRSSESLPKVPASAFTIDRSNHTAYLAIGNQVYYARLP